MQDELMEKKRPDCLFRSFFFKYIDNFQFPAPEVREDYHTPRSFRLRDRDDDRDYVRHRRNNCRCAIHNHNLMVQD
jgi:hypothetical protein